MCQVTCADTITEITWLLELDTSFATSAEVTKAREAATPGAVNNWTASNQVKPRNLPGKRERVWVRCIHHLGVLGNQGIIC